MTTTARFTGVELNAEMVLVARQLCKQYKIERAKFVAGDALALDWNEFDAIYFFNPFGDDRAMAKRTSAKLDALKPGTRVVTYYGYGEPLPKSFERMQADLCGLGPLELWHHV